MRQFLKNAGQLFKDAFAGFGDHKVTKLSGSLAYSTVFSMAPLLVVLIFVSGLILDQEAVHGKIYSQLESFLGPDTASQLYEIVKNAGVSGKQIGAAIIGFVVLLFGATAIFAEIQDSINMIWGIRSKPKKGLLKFLRNRLLSFSLIVSLGFLLLVSLGVSFVLDYISQRLSQLFPDVAVVFVYILNLLITLAVVTFLFATIFKVLPDAKVKWKDVRLGALVTAILFMIGKFAISFYISKASVGSAYGAAGSLVILLVWTYYSSIILYFGAEFTKAYAVKYGSPIHPNQYAVLIEEVEIEKGSSTVQKVAKNEAKNVQKN